MMDIRSLRAFLAVAEEGSLSAAALRLGVAQPSLSQRIGRLETALGGQLLIRSARGVATTALGRRLADHARAILTIVDQAAADLRACLPATEIGARVLLPPCVAPALAGPLAAGLGDADGRGVSVIVEPDPARRLAMMRAGDADLCVATEEDRDGDALAWRLLWRETLALVAAAEPRGASCPPGRLILPPSPCGLRCALDRWRAEHQPGWRVAIEIAASEQRLALAAQGVGWTVVSPATISAVGAQGIVHLPWPGPPLRRSLCAAWNEATGLSPAGAAALALLERCAATMNA